MHKRQINITQINQIRNDFLFSLDECNNRKKINVRLLRYGRTLINFHSFWFLLNANNKLSLFKQLSLTNHGIVNCAIFEMDFFFNGKVNNTSQSLDEDLEQQQMQR